MEELKDYRVEKDKAQEPIIWAQNSDELFEIIGKLKFDYLTDLTAYDNVDGVDGPKRFVVVYQLFSMRTKERVRIKLPVNIGEDVATLTNLMPAANWFEREVYDMFGVKFKGHPDLVRILMDERFEGHPLQKEYGIKDRMPFSDNMKINLERRPY